eukprot:scaffold902_cov254-Ochromonas_danica.AAC.14
MTRKRSRSKRLMGTRSCRNLRSSIEEMPQGLNIEDKRSMTDLARVEIESKTSNICKGRRRKRLKEN